MSTLTITAADLNRGHLGQTVTFAVGEFRVTDKLRAVTHEADLVDDSTFLDELPRFAVGRAQTRVTLINAGEVSITGSTPVEVTP